MNKDMYFPWSAVFFFLIYKESELLEDMTKMFMFDVKSAKSWSVYLSSEFLLSLQNHLSNQALVLSLQVSW